MSSKSKKRGLGKSLSDLGLAALLGNDWKQGNADNANANNLSSEQNISENNPRESENHGFYSEGIEPPQTTDQNTTALAGTLLNINIEKLQPGRYQPRRHMNDDNLQELAKSIQQQGIIQPIIVRQIETDTTDDNTNSEIKYEIVAGERRYRAAKIAEMKTVPAVIQQLTDHDTLAIALIENLQREDLNAIDQAVSLQRMLNEFDLTHQEIADVIGKSRASISNLLRLLNLHPEVQKLVQQNDLEMGHGRALLSISSDKQPVIAEQIISRSLTVRQTEKIIQQLSKQDNINAAIELSAMQQESKLQIEKIQKRLANNLNCKVIVQEKNGKKGGGKLTIHYKDKQQLDAMTTKLMHDID